ncbi:MAG: SdrD B-like domain-containing protein [Holophagaceae bacterium]
MAWALAACGGGGGGSSAASIPSTFSLSGTVSGAVQQGVLINLTGTASAATTTDASGNYAFSNLANGSYTVTPALAGYTFTPSSLTVPVSGANVTGKNFTATAIVPPTYTLSGTVGGAVSQGVQISLTGAAAANTTTDASGNYTFSNLANGSYTVTPALAGYTFTPSSLPVLVSGANVTGKNFTATAIVPPTYTLSGTVGGAVSQGVQISLTGAAAASTTTDAGGNYTFSNLANGSYTVTPALAGYTFTPSSLPVLVSGANVTGKNFTATAIVPTTYTISGTVGGAISQGVQISLTGAAAANTTTDASGNYAFSNLANGSYTVTPALAGYTFTPGSLPVLVSGANVTGKNFTAAPSAPVNLLSFSPAAETTLNYSQTPVALSWTLTGVPEHLSLDGLAVPATTVPPLQVVPHLRHAFTLSAWNSLNAPPLPSLTSGNIIVRGLDLLAGSATTPGSTNGVIAYQGGLSTARFNAPNAVAMDTDGTLYVADTGNNVVRRISTQGVVDTFATGFLAPRGVAVGKGHVVYVADTGHHALKRISPAGVVTEIDPGGALPLWSTSAPTGIATDLGDPGATNTSVWVSDPQNHQVYRFVIRPDGSLFFAASIMGRTDGLAGSTTTESDLAGTSTFGDPLQAPTGVGFYLDPGKTSSGGKWSRGLYVVQQGGALPPAAGGAGSTPMLAAVLRRTVVRVNADGGPGVFEADTSSSTGDQPDGVAVDPATGNAYLSDHVNHVIRFLPVGGTPTLLAGTPSVNLFRPGNLVGFSGTVGTLSAPTGLALVPNALDAGVNLSTLQLGPGDLLITTGHALAVATKPGP